MKDRFNKPIVIKKRDFLECVNVTYQNESNNYLIALSNALMIIVKHRLHDSINFDEYKGVIQL